jgi:hypothetical protein
LVVTFFTSGKCLGEVDVGQRILEGNITAGRQWGASSAVIPIIRRTSFYSLSAVFPSELGDPWFIHDLEILHLVPWVFLFYCS